MARKRVYKFYATYKGKQTDIKLSGVGRIHPEREFEVNEKIYFTLRQDPFFKVRKGFVYEEI